MCSRVCSEVLLVMVGLCWVDWKSVGECGCGWFIRKMNFVDFLLGKLILFDYKLFVVLVVVVE